MSLPLILFMSGRYITAEIRLKGRKTALSGWWFYGRFGALFAIDMWPDWNKKSLVCTFQNYCSSFSACGGGAIWGLAFLSLGLIYVNAPSHFCSFILFCFVFLCFLMNFAPDFHFFFLLNFLELSLPGKSLNSEGSLYFLRIFLISLIWSQPMNINQQNTKSVIASPSTEIPLRPLPSPSSYSIKQDSISHKQKQNLYLNPTCKVCASSLFIVKSFL